jgi:hypothetical protein
LSTNCKLCGLLPDAELSTALMTKSSRWIANNYAIGKTTVNTHRKACMGISVPEATEARMEDNELKEVVWNGDKGELRTGTLSQSLTNVSPESILKMFGYNTDEVEIVGVLREKHAQYWSQDLEEMLWKHSYAFGVKRKQAAEITDSIDPVALLKELGIKSKTKTTNKVNGEDSTWVLDWADWQVCKAEGGGSAGFVQRFDQVMENAQIRLDELRSTGRKLNELLIIGGGDIVEGCVIYPQQSFHIDGHRRDQIRLAVATILQGLYTLAPQFDKVRLLVVPGNHGEHRINGNRTAIGDNDDLLVFEMAQVAIANDPNMQHVSFEIAEDEVSMVTEVQGWKYGATHGDVYGRSGGSGIRNKVFNWIRTMAANRHPVGLVDVLVTHHYHHDALEDWGSMLWVQNPTMDGGSHYYKEATGHYARHGMNSWVVTKSERFQDKQVLR